MITVETVAEDDTLLTGRMVILDNGERAAIVVGLTPTAVAEAYLPTIEAVIESFVITEPTVEDVFVDFLSGDYCLFVGPTGIVQDGCKLIEGGINKLSNR